MDLIQPLFLNQSGRTETAELGVANSSWSQTFIFDVIQKDIDKGVDSFLLFIKPEEKACSFTKATFETLFNNFL